MEAVVGLYWALAWVAWIVVALSGVWLGWSIRRGKPFLVPVLLLAVGFVGAALLNLQMVPITIIDGSIAVVLGYFARPGGRG